jgi:hypothetical protein
MVNFKELNVDNIKFTEPKSGQYGKNAWVKNGNKRLVIQTPMMTTWGIQPKYEKWDPKADHVGETPTGFSMSLQFPNDEYPDQNASDFLDVMEQIQEKIVEHVCHEDNYKKFMTKANNMETCETFKSKFVNMIRYSYDDKGNLKEQFGPTMRLKIPLYNGICKTAVFDITDNTSIYSERIAKETKMTIDEFNDANYIPKLSKVVSIIECGGIWSNSSQWGITWKLYQAYINTDETSDNIEEPVLVQEHVDTSTVNYSTPECPPNVGLSDNTPAETVVDDSDGGEDGGEDGGGDEDGSGGECGSGSEDGDGEPSPKPKPPTRRNVRRTKKPKQ